MRRPILRSSLLPLCASALLFTAAAFKAQALLDGVTTLHATGALIIDIGLGAWLVSRAFARWAKWTAVITFTAFALYSVVQHAEGAKSCGCFGRIATPPIYTALLDVCVAVTMLLWTPRRNTAEPQELHAHVLAWCSVGSLVALVVVLRLLIVGNSGADSPATYLVETWPGKQLPILERIDVGNELMVGQWRVILHNRSCEHCRELLPNCDAELPTSYRLALIEVPPIELHVEEFQVEPQTAHIVGRLLDESATFISLPIKLVVHDGVVISANHL